MEKLGVEKTQLVQELQGEYSRLRAKQHGLRKEASAINPGEMAQLDNEIREVTAKLDDLQKEND